MYLGGKIGKSTSLIVYRNPGNAERSIAGVPAVARAVHQAARAGMDSCIIAAGRNWRPGTWVAGEIDRLAGGMHVQFAEADAAELAASLTEVTAIAGEQLFEADQPGAEWQIMLATSKPGDGLVSRNLNRPISRRISWLLLKLRWIRPMHATAMTALVAIAMLAVLLAGGGMGLLVGACLFQAASILDGVDGEIARATFRTSRSGAAADSLVDAATNVAFIGGVVANLWLAGHEQVAAVGAVGLGEMAFGLLLLGLNARSSSGNLTFDLVKHQFGQRPSRLKKWLTWLTMRDFYALAGFAFVASGWASVGLVAFAIVATGWLMVVLAVLGRTRLSGSERFRPRSAPAPSTR